MLATIVFLASIRLPVVELPAARSPVPWFAVFLSGDGGWRAIDIETSEELNRHGINVVGVKSDEYFSIRRTPEEIGRDVAQLIEAYAAKWRKGKVVLVGFSRGADALPIALAHLPPQTRARVVLTALLGPALHAELEVVPWWQLGRSTPQIALAPVVRSLRGVRFLCVHGEEEDESLCDAVRSPDILDVKTRGAHHFDRDYPALARTILSAVPPER